MVLQVLHGIIKAVLARPAYQTLVPCDQVKTVSGRNGSRWLDATRFATVTRAISASASFVRKA